ncbi:MAG: hypothetical protein HY001_03765 [Candidatus Portnoybacteria bacterium]|nr:hypothetical protein [Candidatus Portnoybacteria bacterium]
MSADIRFFYPVERLILMEKFGLPDFHAYEKKVLRTMEILGFGWEDALTFLLAVCLPEKD